MIQCKKLFTLFIQCRAFFEKVHLRLTSTSIEVNWVFFLSKSLSSKMDSGSNFWRSLASFASSPDKYILFFGGLIDKKKGIKVIVCVIVTYQKNVAYFQSYTQCLISISIIDKHTTLLIKIDNTNSPLCPCDLITDHPKNKIHIRNIS